MNKYIISTLIGSSYGAAGPLPAAGWPAYTTSYTAASTDKNSAGAWNPSFSTQFGVSVGPYRGYRIGHIIFPTQKVNKAGASAAGTVSAQSTTRTFWQLTQAQLGTNFSPLDSTSTTTIGNTIASAAGWVVCDNATTTAKCNGGVGQTTASSPAQKDFVNRVVLRANSSTNPVQLAEGNNTTFKWNYDFTMASFFHAEFDDTLVPLPSDGKTWCSTFQKKMTDNKEIDLTAIRGLSGKTKCTWQLSTKDETTAPGFRLFYATDYLNFMIQWSEWISESALGTGGTLPATDAADFYLGAYDKTKGVWINPQESDLTGWKSGKIFLGYTDYNPTTRPGGSIGDVIYYTNTKGMYEKTQTITVDSTVIMKQVDSKKKDFASFEKENKDYDEKRERYDKEAKKKEDNQKDVFKQAFAAQVNVPERPSMPSQPSDYDGPLLDLSKALTIGSKTGIEWSDANKDKIGRSAYLKNTIGAKSNKPDPTFATRVGYMQTTLDTSKTGGYLKFDNVDNVGHIFGKLGQSYLTNPFVNGNKPFYWGKIDTKDAPGMMISMFPGADSDAGIGSGQEVKFKAKQIQWEDVNAYAPPPQPPKPKAPVASPFASFAKFISVGVATSITLSSLY